MAKVLVTGGAGFIGSHVADALLQRGDDVHVMDSLVTGHLSNLHPSVHFHHIDLNSPQVPELLNEHRFQRVYHLAAQMDVRVSVKDPAYDAQTNVLGSVRLLQAAWESGTEKVLYAASGGTCYGNPDRIPTPIHAPIQPISPYGITKHTVEYYLAYYSQFGLKWNSLRLANVYGPRQNAHGEAGVVAIFASRLLAGEQPSVFGDGLQTRDFVHVHDVARAFMLATDFPENMAFNIGTGTETTVNDLFDTIRDHVGSPIQRHHAPAKDGEARRNALDASHTQQVLGWKPELSLSEGLKLTVDWFRARREAQLTR